MLSWRQIARASLHSATGLIAVFTAHAAAAQMREVSSFKPTTALEAMRLLKDETRVKSGKEFFKGVAFVGSKACAQCHAERHAEWAETWHAKFERWPTADVMVGDFDTTVHYKNVRAIDVAGNDVRGPDGKVRSIDFKIKTFTRQCPAPHADMTVNVCRDGCDAPAGPVKTGPAKSSTYYCFTVLDGKDGRADQTFTIAKALGGKWDQHYEVWIGTRLAVAPLRWAVQTKEWIVNAFRLYEWAAWEGDGWRPRKPEEYLKHRFAEAKCTGCHTTGYEYTKDKDGYWNVKGDIFGTGQGQGELGIACEHCHGPGAKHVDEAKAAEAKGAKLASGTSTIINPLKDLDFHQQNQMCGKCHGRQGSRVHPDQNFQQDKDFMTGDRDLHDKARFWSFWSQSATEQAYFWPNDWAKRNRQQYQDFLKSTHYTKGGLTCLTCHTFHGTKDDGKGKKVVAWEEGHLRQKADVLCASCHNGQDGYAQRDQVAFYDGSQMQKAGVQCMDCHMPKSAFRTNSTSKFPRQWHGTLHTFQVATPAIEKQHGVRNSCSGCHITGTQKPLSGKTPPYLDLEDLDHKLKGKQAETRKRMDAVREVLRRVDGSANKRAAALADNALAKLNVVVADGSLGFHNWDKAYALLDEARKLAEQARKLAPREAPPSATSPSTAPKSGTKQRADDPAAPVQSTAAAGVQPVASGQLAVTAAVGGPAPSAAPAPTAPASLPAGSTTAAGAVAGEPVAGEWYVSRPGDSLWTIARKVYGSGTGFRAIYDANRTRMTSGPHFLPPGSRIFVPKPETRTDAAPARKVRRAELAAEHR